MNQVDRKQSLRSLLLAKRQDMHGLQELSLVAQEYILAEPIWQSASSVALYMPSRGEVDTALLRQKALEQGKTLWLPRCRAGVPGILDFVPCSSTLQLCAGAFGLMEPSPELSAMPPEAAPDLLVIPAVAYDKEGFRLGYGGGYYDRLLARPTWHSCCRIGLVAEELVLPELPRDVWDQPVAALATERSFVWL